MDKHEIENVSKTLWYQLPSSSSCPSSNDTCVRDGCREGSDDSTRVDCYTIPIPPMVCPPHTAHPTFPMESKHRGGIAVADSGAAHARGGGEEVAPEGGSLPEREKRFPLFLSLFGSITGRDNKALSLRHYLPFVQEDSTTTTSSSLIPTARARTSHRRRGGEEKVCFFSFRVRAPPLSASSQPIRRLAT
jgi:hypothetical protein